MGYDLLVDAVMMEDHNTFDMMATTIGAPLMQETFNPSLEFRRFIPGEARGVARKLYMPADLAGMRVRFCSRVRQSDEPVVPVTPGGSLYLWFGFRTDPDWQWSHHKTAVAHPNQSLTNWSKWYVDLPFASVLAAHNVSPSTFVQLAIVRKSDDPQDTATDTVWDLLAMNIEVY